MALPKEILHQLEVELSKKKWGLQSSPIIPAKAVSPCESSYGGELEAIKLGIDAIFKNIGYLKNFIYSDSRSAIQSVMGKNREFYHNI